MVREDGATKLADFGIASVQGDPRLTATGLVVGSPAYMAPEQVEAQAVSPATDLWALGATLWFAVEGQPPFGGGEFQTLSAIVNGQPRRPERLGPLTPVLARLLVKDPAGRATPAQLRPLLRQVAASEGGGPGTAQRGWATPAATPPAIGRRPPCGRRPQRPGPGGPERSSPTHPGRCGPGPTHPAGTAPPAGPRPGVSVASGDTPPVPSRVQRREEDAGTAVRGAAPGRRRRLPPVPPVPLPGEPVFAGGRRRRVRLPVVFAAVAVVLVGSIIWQGVTRDDDQRTPSATTRRPGVPAGWRSFQDPDGTYRLSFPPTWTPTDRGPFIDFTEPGGERFFRVQPTTDGMAPLTAQRSLERSFMARHPGDDYRRLRLGATTFRGVPAAEWEFTFLNEGRPTRGYDITFTAGGRRHAILFQSPASRWAASQRRAPVLPGRLPRPRLTAAGPAAVLAAVAAAAGAVHRLQGVDQDLALGVAQGGVGVGEHVAARRHGGVGDRVGGVVGLAVVLSQVEKLSLSRPCSTSRAVIHENGATKLCSGQRVWLLWQS